MEIVIMEIKYQFWLENNGEVILSKTCDALLRGIDELHSLYATTRLLKKSYRSAWGKIRKSEELLGFRLVESKGPGKGLYLTEEARAVLEIIDKLEQNSEAFINWYLKNPDCRGNIFVVTDSKKVNPRKNTNIPAKTHSKKSASVKKKIAAVTAC
jgi:molybdate transport system regulatory protein